MATEWPTPGDDDAFWAPPLPSDLPARRTVQEEAIAERELFGLAVDRTSVARAINQRRQGDRGFGGFMTPEELADEEAVSHDLPDQAERILTAAGAELGTYRVALGGGATVRVDHGERRPCTVPSDP